ncbi:sodium:pantothenate symporter [Bacillus sp. J14TS2]|uniref:YhdT family protein n=1 Tax=Bacillus sp. J14TS2 TaxID=2807188 RepID=UPI001B26F7A0|nr:YhdT family protein [Bacillus sp. J14TS2]GIN70158.1 sodium:pantothenate symporter [Bacillus sp. J14TS2]
MKKLEMSDKQIRISRREARIGVGLVIFHFLWWYGFAYGLGNKPVEEYQYILGFPAWFFYSSILGFIIIFLLVVLFVKTFFHELSFEEEDEN